MKGIVLVTGSEFTQGRKYDKNGVFIAKKLFERGVDVSGIIISPDSLYELTNYIKYALDRADLVFISGGLGPTTDDLTRQAVANAIGVPLIYHEGWLAKLKQEYKEINVEITEERKSMAKIPYGAAILENPVGRASGFIKILDDVKKAVVALPGVPSEMEPMFNDALNKLGLTEKKRYTQLYRVFGIKELDLNYLLEDIKNISYNFSPKGIDLFIWEEEQKEFIETKQKIKSRLGNFIYSEDETEMEEVVGKMLKEKGLTVATAESSTGGLIVSRLVNVPGSSQYVLGSIVSYSNEVKINVLKVKKEDIQTLGAVSEPVAKQMAENVRLLLNSDIAVSDTGIAGPTGETPDKPIGLHYIGFTDGKETKVYKEIYKGSRNDVRFYISQYALNLIRLYLINY
ncbi:CinA family nicotinamide mononucleotide deamidase-related protein [Sulfurihydrogenibium sp.]|uniref:CinA family nicotinamide mononucleotide deamidase-related protein n=1 Tax=Sulfurihydrogenibium sp. TaxID=2053621 RepID=UPI0026056ACC|nr:CinA family nicotinamide mononucleotide deamidase-related protein [Sulfurihydrogenibium sp.]